MRFFKTKFGFGKGVPGPHLRVKFHYCGFKNVGYSPQNREKNGNLWYKFAPKEKFRGLTVKVEYRCTTTNLPLCNGTIIVLKIALLYSVSVITNFVIPKRDKQTYKNITLFRLHSTAGARPTIPTILGTVIKEVRPIFEPLTFLIRPVVFPLGAIEYLKGKWQCPYRGKMPITWLFVSQKQPN